MAGTSPAKGLLDAGSWTNKSTQMAQTTRSNRKVLVLPGDGIGPEIMGEAMRVIDFFDRRHLVSFEVDQGVVGGAAYDASGTPLTDVTLTQVHASDPVQIGSAGRPKWQTFPLDLHPLRTRLKL